MSQEPSPDLTQIKVDLGVLKNQMGTVAEAVEGMRRDLQTQMASKSELRVLEVKVENQEEKIKSLQSTVNWLGRTFIGAIITGLVAFIWAKVGASK